MTRTSLVLLGIALSLLAFIVFYERGTVSTDEHNARRGRLLDAFVRDRVSRIELQRKGVTTVLTRYEADQDDPLSVGGFRVEQPYKAKADQHVVDNLLGAIEWLQPRRTLGEASAKDLERFGLAHPRYRFAFQVGRERQGFSIGHPAADGGGVYLALAGTKKVYVVGNDIIEALDHVPQDFHDKALYDGVVSIDTLQRLSLRDGSGERQLSRRDGFVWITAPYSSLASQPELTKLMDALDGLRATRYVAGADAQLAKYGLDTPSFELTLDSRAYDTNRKGKSHIEKLELAVGAACAPHAGESYVRVNTGPIMCAAGSELDKLKKSADDLRERRVLPLDDSEIKGVELAAHGKTLSLTRSGDSMRYRLLDAGKEQKVGTADKTALEHWLSALRGLSIQGFDVNSASSAAQPGQGKPELTATFHRGKDEVDYTLQLYAPAGAQAYATRMNEPSRLQLPAQAGPQLALSVARYRKLRVIDESEADWKKLVVQRADGPTETVTAAADGYRLEGPLSASAQRSTIDEIKRMVTKLDAVRYVADKAAPQHGLDHPYRTLRVEFASDKGSRTYTLLIGAAADDATRFARLQRDPAVFLLADALPNRLANPLVSLEAPAAGLDRLSEFELSSPQRRVKVTRSPQGFAVQGESGDAALTRGKALARTLMTLHASRAVAYGKARQDEGFEHPKLRVLAKLSDGAEVELSFAERGNDKDSVGLRRAGLDVGFEISRTVLDALLEQPQTQARE